MAKPPTKSTNIRDLSATANPAAPHRPSARRSEHDRRRDDRAGTRGRGRIDDFRLQRRRHPAHLRRRVLLQRRPREEGRAADAAHRAGERAGRGFHGRGLCARQRPRRRGLVTSGPGATNTVTPVRDCMADSMPIVVICGQVPTAPSARMRSRKRRCLRSWARSPSTSSSSPTRRSSKPRCAPRSRSRAPAGPGPVVIDVPKDVQNWAGRVQGHGHAAHARAIASALETLTTDIIDGTEANHFFEMLGEAQRPLIYAGGGVINGNASDALREFARGLRHSRGHHAHGHRRGRHHQPARDAHARHARRGVRELRGRRLRFPDRRRRAVRRSRRRHAGEVRAERQAHRAPRHRPRRDQQGEARAVEPRRHAARGAAHAHGARQARGVQARPRRVARGARGAASASTR